MRRTLLLLMALVGIITGLAAQSDIADGFQTGVTDYFVDSQTGLAKLAEIVNDGNDLTNCTITLKNNIVLKDDGAGMSASGWRAIGLSTPPDYTNSFNGTFDGAGFAISGLWLERDHGALFGKLGENGFVKNLNVKLGDKGVTATIQTAGLVCYNCGTITACSIEGDVTVTGVFSAVNAGGLTLTNEKTGLIIACFSKVNATATGTTNAYYNAGSLAVTNKGIIANSYATGKVTINGASDTGETNNIGAFVAINSGNINNCFAIGEVSVSSANVVNKGGFIGQNTSDGALSGCLFDKTTTSLEDGIGRTDEPQDIAGEETSGMKKEITYSTFDFSETWKITDSYPYLAWEDDVNNGDGDGDGGDDTPNIEDGLVDDVTTYIVDSQAGLAKLAEIVNGKECDCV